MTVRNIAVQFAAGAGTDADVLRTYCERLIAFELQEVHFADEVRDVAADRTIVNFAGRADLFDSALVHDDYAVGKRHRFLLIVDEYDGDVQIGLDLAELFAHLLADFRVLSAEKGSSSSNTLGLRSRLRAIAMRCC